MMANCDEIGFELPDDVLVEILCRLPERSLIRLKCVSNSWHNLINNVCIPKLSATAPVCGFVVHSSMVEGRYTNELVYATLTSPPDAVAIAEAEEFVQSYEALLPFIPAPRDFLDCCNGLLLFLRGCDCWESRAPGCTVYLQYYVCNPATKQCVEIPGFVGEYSKSYTCLAFNPSKSPHYKVVRMVYIRCKHGDCYCEVLKLNIFSSDTGKWITLEMPAKASVRIRVSNKYNHENEKYYHGYGIRKYSWITRVIYLDGVLYKLSTEKLLLCFDLNEMNVREIELPERGTSDMGIIGASRGRLYYASHDGTKVLIWLLEDHSLKLGSPWIMKPILCNNPSIEDPMLQLLYLIHEYCPFGFGPYAWHPTSEVLFLGDCHVIFSYHLESKRLEIVLDRNNIDVHRGRLYPYSRCLVSLKDFLPRHYGSNQSNRFSNGTIQVDQGNPGSEVRS
ncbi:F-box protein At5g07610-like isoform X2 [Tripterygium wilfordii]|uniref:F-box protein At5g07610-like isoform X2 n=1 Tax=Tripterygium wilfordii TaxID=458696 RepID=UPI0018F861FE|nr:F-box protein At5g07610-like isoform X2 [Tripterygium wilfordii]